MKKMWKHYGKIYVFLIGLLSLISAVRCFNFNQYWDEILGERTLHIQIQDLPSQIYSVFDLDSQMFMITIIAYFVLKFVQYYTQNRKAGRAFAATLPVTKKKMELFYLLADTCLLVIPNWINIIFALRRYQTCWAQFEIKLPWLLSKRILFLLLFAVVIFLIVLAFRLIENMIVSGPWKMIGLSIVLFLGFSAVGDASLQSENDAESYFGDYVRETQYNTSSIFEDLIEKYNTMYERATQEMNMDEAEEVDYVNFYNENVDFELYRGQYASMLEVDYKGMPIGQSYFEEQLTEDASSKNRMVDDPFSESFEWLMFDYEMSLVEEKLSLSQNGGLLCGLLILVIVLFSLFMVSVQKRDESKQILYFSWVKYLFAAEAGAFIFIYGMDFANDATSLIGKYGAYLIYGCTAIVIMVLCVYILTPVNERKVIRKAKPGV